MAQRNESVRLSFQDDYTAGVLKAAAATAVLDKAINGLDGKSLDTSRDIDRNTASINAFSRSADRSGSSIDQFSGRLGLLAKAAAVLGPALIPVGALAVPAVAGLANQFGFAAVAAGTAVLAFQGVGDTLTAVNKAALEPTAENMQAARDAMAALSPAGRDLVNSLEGLKPLFTALRDTGQEAMFPGLIRGFESLERLGPQVNQIVSEVGSTLGDLFAEGAASLSGDRWADFFQMLATEARPTLTDMGHALGDFVHGLSELWEAFAPLNADFGGWMADVANGFDKRATGLSKTEGFQEFLAYIDQMGPKVAEAVGAIANALLQIVEASAPIAGPVLEAITGLANAIATIADSPLGTPIMAAVTAMSALSLAASLGTASVTRLNTALIATGAAGTKAGAGLAGIAGGPAGIAAGIGLLNLGDALENIKMTLSGDRNPVEGLARLVAGMSPVGEVANLLGVDIMGVNKEIGALAKGTTDWAGALEGNRTALAKLASGASLSAAEIRGLTDAMRENRNAALGAFDAVTQYRQALKNARAQADKNNAGIRGSSKAALENRDALSQLAAAWNNQSAAVRNNTAKFREARGAFIQTAVAMGVPIDRAKELAREILAIPRSKVAKVNLEGAPAAVSSANAVEQAIGRIQSKTVTITMNRVGSLNPFDSGGYTGNLDKQDVAGVVHGREVVLPESIVQRDKSMLLQRYGHLPNMSGLRGYESGGLVTTSRSSDLGGPVMGGMSNGTWSKLDVQLAILTERFARATRQLRMMEKALERQEKAIDKQREVVNDAAQAIQDTLAQMASFRSDISGRLTKGIFEGGTDFGSVIGTLQGNQQAGNSWLQSLSMLQSLGLDGPALQALLQQSDATQLAGVASWTPEQIAQFESLFNSSTGATEGAGQLSAQAVFGQQLAEDKTRWAEEKIILAEQVALGREMARGIKAQEKYIQWLEKKKDRVEEREKDNHDNIAKTAKALSGAGDAARRKS